MRARDLPMRAGRQIGRSRVRTAKCAQLRVAQARLLDQLRVLWHLVRDAEHVNRRIHDRDDRALLDAKRRANPLPMSEFSSPLNVGTFTFGCSPLWIALT